MKYVLKWFNFVLGIILFFIALWYGEHAETFNELWDAIAIAASSIFSICIAIIIQLCMLYKDMTLPDDDDNDEQNTVE
jgi:hypothetical protein